MNIKDKETSKRYPFWRVITGVVGILASSISLILMYKSVSTALTIGLILSLIFFYSIYFFTFTCFPDYVHYYSAFFFLAHAITMD